MKILVTGGAGFIGSHVVDRYVAAGHRVVVVDDLSTGRRDLLNPAATFHRLDIRDPAIADVFAAERPEVLNHHAAQIDVRRSVEDPAHDAAVNVVGSLNLLGCARRFGVRTVVYASSGGAVYGDTPVLPTPEEHPTRPASPYGVSKLTVEYYLACWEALYGVRWVALRYANVYGPRQNPMGEAGVIAIFAHRLRRGEPVTIHGDGLQTRDYVYVDDVAAANVAALERGEASGPINIGTGRRTTVVELYRILRGELGGAEAPHHGPPKAGEQRDSALDAARARERLGWTPRVGLEEGLRRTAAYFRAADASGAPAGRA